MITDEQRATALVERFQGDLLELMQSDLYRAAPHVVITGLLHTAGVLMRGGARLEPKALQVFVYQLELLRAYVVAPAAVAEEPTTPSIH